MRLSGRWTLATAILTCTVSNALHADPPPATYARPETDARALALAGAAVATTTGAPAVFWNPALLESAVPADLVLVHRGGADGLTLSSGAFVMRPAPMSRFRIGLGANLLRRSGTAAREAVSSFRGDPGAYGYFGSVHAAFAPHAAWSFGAGVGRFATFPTTSGRGTGWSADAGLAWSRGATRAGIAVRGLTWNVSDVEDTRRERWSLGLGRSIEPARLLLGVQIDRERAVPLAGAFGAEWRAIPSLWLRSGARHVAERPLQYAAGFGFGRDGMRIDYAVRSQLGARPEHLVSLAVAFGPGIATDRTSTDVAPAATSSRKEIEAAPASPPPRLEPKLIVPPPLPPPPPVRQDTEPRSKLDARPLPRPSPEPRSLLEDPAPAPPVTRATLEEAPRNGNFVVRAGVHPDLDSAAQEILRLYREELRPQMERRGEMYIVVVQRCRTRAEAQEWQERARRAGVRTSIDEE